MSYLEYCEQSYHERIKQKAINEVKRKEFIKNRLLAHKVITVDNIPETIKELPEQVLFSFQMPEIVPSGSDKLKWLVFQNLELIKKCPERKVEAESNIKLIKSHIKNASWDIELQKIISELEQERDNYIRLYNEALDWLRIADDKLAQQSKIQPLSYS